MFSSGYGWVSLVRKWIMKKIRGICYENTPKS